MRLGEAGPARRTSPRDGGESPESLRDFDPGSSPGQSLPWRPRRGCRRIILALLLLCVPALAVEPDERLADPALESRARAISQDLRCLVCQNQSIDDSRADLARDLRILLRERLTAGDTDDEAVAFIVDRYGDYVLLRPPFRIDTLLLWLGPPLLLLLGGGAAYLAVRRRRAATLAEAPLSAEEEEALAAALRGQETRP